MLGGGSPRQKDQPCDLGCELPVQQYQLMETEFSHVCGQRISLGHHTQECSPQTASWQITGTSTVATHAHRGSPHQRGGSCLWSPRGSDLWGGLCLSFAGTSSVVPLQSCPLRTWAPSSYFTCPPRHKGGYLVQLQSPQLYKALQINGLPPEKLFCVCTRLLKHL